MYPSLQYKKAFRLDRSVQMPVVGQWLLCVWQASAVGASWWAVLMLLLTLWGVEVAVLPPRRARHGWPELLRAWVTLISVYWACMLLFATLWSGGRAMGTILVVLTTWALLVVWAPVPQALFVCDVVAMGVGLLATTRLVVDCAPRTHTPLRNDWLGWVHLVCLLHLMLASNRHEGVSLWRATASLLVVVPALFLGASSPCVPVSAPWMLLALPSVGMQMQPLIREFIAPLIDGLCHPSLYSLQVSYLVFWHRLYHDTYDAGRQEGSGAFAHGGPAAAGAPVLSHGLGDRAGVGMPELAECAAGAAATGRAVLAARSRDGP
jgi:hypothetical protein